MEQGCGRALNTWRLSSVVNNPEAAESDSFSSSILLRIMGLVRANPSRHLAHTLGQKDNNNNKYFYKLLHYCVDKCIQIHLLHIKYIVVLPWKICKFIKSHHTLYLTYLKQQTWDLNRCHYDENVSTNTTVPIMTAALHSFLYLWYTPKPTTERGKACVYLCTVSTVTPDGSGKE